MVTQAFDPTKWTPTEEVDGMLFTAAICEVLTDAQVAAIAQDDVKLGVELLDVDGFEEALARRLRDPQVPDLWVLHQHDRSMVASLLMQLLLREDDLPGLSGLRKIIPGAWHTELKALIRDQPR